MNELKTTKATLHWSGALKGNLCCTFKLVLVSLLRSGERQTQTFPLEFMKKKTRAASVWLPLHNSACSCSRICPVDIISQYGLWLGAAIFNVMSIKDIYGINRCYFCKSTYSSLCGCINLSHAYFHFPSEWSLALAPVDDVLILNADKAPSWGNTNQRGLDARSISVADISDVIQRSGTVTSLTKNCFEAHPTRNVKSLINSNSGFKTMSLVLSVIFLIVNTKHDSGSKFPSRSVQRRWDTNTQFDLF